MVSLLLGAALAAGPAELPVCQLTEGAWLLTMAPGDDVQTLFGHTAVLVYDPAQRGYSPVYDYGRFEIDPLPTMAWEVLTMTKRYTVGYATLDDTAQRYDGLGRGIVAQRLLLEPDQARALARVLSDDLNAPLSFDYNWYRPNCTTLVQERLDAVLGGALQAASTGDSGISPARQVLRHSAPHLPLWFGLHWGSGRAADQNVSRWDAAFLPDSLRAEVERVQIAGRPLAAPPCQLTRTPVEPVATDAPNRDGLLAGIGLVWALGLAAAGRSGTRAARYALVIHGLGVGVFGCAALLVGALGTFAPFWGHHNLTLASPLHLLLVPAAVVRGGFGRGVGWGLAAVVGLGLLWSALGGFADRNLGLVAMFGLPALAVAWGLRR